MAAIEEQNKEKAKVLYAPSLPWIPFVKKQSWRSLTVAHFFVQNAALCHEKARKKQMELGKGYGQWKDKTLRIANFPAHSMENIKQLIETLHP